MYYFFEEDGTCSSKSYSQSALEAVTAKLGAEGSIVENSSNVPMENIVLSGGVCSILSSQQTDTGYEYESDSLTGGEG